MDAKAAAAALMGMGSGTASEAVAAVGAATFGKVLSLSDIFTKVKLAAEKRPAEGTIAALRLRITEGKAKVDAAEAAGHRSDKVARARQTIAELEDELADLVRREAAHFALESAYIIGREFRDYREAMGVDSDNLLTFNVPGVANFVLDLNGQDDEPPF